MMELIAPPRPPAPPTPTPPSSQELLGVITALVLVGKGEHLLGEINHR